jgi:GR25 family glycosyltransferase involved in LPS biosynthesis
MLSNIGKMKDITNIFYINLDSRPDRKTHFEKEIKKIGLQATRFNAIKQKSGAVGCSMSHLALLKYAKNNNLDHILIMEDDICFLNPEVFMNSFNSFLSNNIDFDVLLIAGNNMEPYTKINDFCVKIQKCQTTTGYLVKQHYYDKLIENIEAGIKNLLNDITKTNDFAIDQYWTKLQITDKWILLTPLTVTQKPDYSNVEKRIINYNRVMLDLDKKHLIHVGKNKTNINLLNIFNDIILN